MDAIASTADLTSILGITRVGLWRLRHQSRGPSVTPINARFNAFALPSLVDWLVGELAAPRRARWLKALAAGPQGAVA